jgi:PKD repeat protein
MNDVWKSTDNGATWSQITENAEWFARNCHSIVSMPDGSIVLTGGYNGGNRNDVWRIMPAGSSVQNPSHTYSEPGIYRVSLQSFNIAGYNNKLKNDYITVTSSTSDYDRIGLFRPSIQMWYLDYDNSGASDFKIKWGDGTDIPVAGDWDGDNQDEIGLYRPSTQMWYLDYDNNGLSNFKVKWGDSTDIPVTGDWDGDNIDEIGLYRPSTQMWYLDYDNSGLSDFKVKWGDSTDIPVAGAWN